MVVSMRICDDDYYWFVAFKVHNPVTQERRDILQSLGIDPDTEEHTEVNLWRCRHCGAMIHGGDRDLHARFHDLVGRPTR